MSTTELFGEYQASTETPSSAPTDRKKGAVALHDEGSRGFLGTVRLRNDQTGEVILVPTPSNDPNDPLNWPQWYKNAVAALICCAMLMCNFLAAGPTIALVETAVDFFPDAADPASNPDAFDDAVAAVAYYFTTTSLLQGISNFVWVPLANKYGRRPVYILSYTIYLACAVWLVFEESYNGFLAGRILMGVGAGAAETIAPISIADIFFLHERGTIMALYTAFLSAGVAFGMVVSGLITIDHDWRTIYSVAAILISMTLLAAVLIFPETARDAYASRYEAECPLQNMGRQPVASDTELEHHGNQSASALRRRGYVQSLKIFTGVHTSESLWRIAVRPFGLILLPPVLWAALVESVTIGFLVAVTSNVDVAFEGSYDFESYQVGLCFISGVIGALIGIFAGGHLSDWVADVLTKRNGGVREPEMRLPAMIPPLITTPLALILFGVGIEQRLHWICPTVGLGLLNFSITSATNVCLVYVIDAYRPVAGEITLAVMGFKSIFGFLLSFYTNPWVDDAGFMDAYGSMAGIAAVVILGWIPLYVWGSRIRKATLSWPAVRFVRWSRDREVGE
ncbi:hypothetical protein MCOR27_003829 [Pyricularia oryzae]|uniref:Major facilitator superfamily (MFS) profile domain-containing protein n=3 Tax=Pyricularia TaxID=48558 RepID=A0ABQ8NJN6_PYRGI|nr:uncharacterized protein MGG_11713 [Pyricularia oryzae 70-15]KAH8841825.1 hypothetical protein MCOR01_005779 [Pyricularia oryzae]KAI6298150.1 hypothetical protein MCOR33_005687 [Pyricularia grisea]EHA57445.1 hypothetical protein MGG_11713 [Pyricularia oryzae 70-15]KAI6281195.1 hypothetical protein MCOR26_003386 [Pyricularia oryzae]KAI6282239.1 hypothetical protein MCOR27_003829 [Pyricularia oryzae]